MKNKLSYILFIILGLSLVASNTFAANPPYDIEYTGGEPLSASNVTINPDLINGLTPLIKVNGTTRYTFSNSNRWQQGYISRGNGTVCSLAHYFKVWDNNQVSNTSNLSYTMQYGKYLAEINFENVVLDGDMSLATENDSYAVVVVPANGLVYASERIFDDPQCSNRTAGIKPLSHRDDMFIYIQSTIKLYENDKNTPLVADGLYFGITDIDAAQSYKILNPNNLLTPSNMFTKSEAGLQSNDPNTTLRNMYVADKNYIYSEYDSSTGGADISSNIFVKLTTQSQQEGLKVVFGYKQTAGSGVEYYAKQYTVTYDSDENGSITGITSENIISGLNPSGSTSTPKEGYELDYWITDKDVTLKNGTTIKAGEKLTITQIKEVVVNQDLKFTAIHKDEIKVPNTGVFTKDTNATAIILPIFGIIIGALIIRFTLKSRHKRVDFKRR